MQCRRKFNLFLLWLTYLFLLIAASMGDHELSETEALISFIRSVDPENVTETNWNMSSTDPCLDHWMGVKCDPQTHTIIEIKLENWNLSGIIDADSLCKLPSLRILSLAKNNMHGSIPDSISNCASLTHLNLSSNLLQGRIPSSLTKLKNLWSLDISNNKFSWIPNSRQEFKSLRKFGIDLNSIVHAERPSPAVPSSPHSDKRLHYLWQLFPLVIGLAVFMLFIYFVSKRAAKSSVKEKEILLFLEGSSMKIRAAKTEEETKREEERKEPVFFVEEHVKFKMEDLLESAADLQGQNLCSSLYKVILKNNMVFAVKRLKKLQVSFEEFSHSMSQIGNLKHPNILPLVAYHFSGEEKLLIYNYQRNGSLLALLENFTDGKRDFPWRLRLTIARGIARGLDFIHRKRDGGGGHESIPHGNIKLSNILLTENEEPLISEYGYQRFLDPKKACLYSSNGYQAPEKQMTEKADVFSFGVILLELLTGKTVERSGLDLPKWVKSMVREEWTGEVFDKEVNKAGKEWAFPLLNVSLKCVSHFPENRPRIAEVLEKLEEVVNVQEEFSFSSTSSMESNSNEQDCCILHTVIPETWETPGSNH